MKPNLAQFCETDHCSLLFLFLPVVSGNIALTPFWDAGNWITSPSSAKDDWKSLIEIGDGNHVVNNYAITFYKTKFRENGNPRIPSIFNVCTIKTYILMIYLQSSETTIGASKRSAKHFKTLHTKASIVVEWSLLMFKNRRLQLCM